MLIITTKRLLLGVILPVKNQDGEEWVNVKQAAGIDWLGVDLHYCWLGKDLHNNAVAEIFRDNN